MGQTIKRHYDRYTLEFKTTAVRLADIPTVSATEIAVTLGIHVVMLYRWRMELNNGTLRENKRMTKEEPEKKSKKRTDPARQKHDELVAANKKIKQLEKALANRDEELDLLKKAKRFFEAKRK